MQHPTWPRQVLLVRCRLSRQLVSHSLRPADVVLSNGCRTGSGAEPRLLEEAAAGDGSLEQLQLVVGGGGGPSSSGSSSSAASTLKVRVVVVDARLPRDTLSAAYAHCLSLTSPQEAKPGPKRRRGGWRGARSGGPGAC